MKKLKIKRFCAYLIDIFVISLFVIMLGKIKFLNPYTDKYHETYEKYAEYYGNVMSSETGISPEDLINDEYAGYMKQLSLYSVTNILTEVIVIVLYFTMFPKFNNNQTIGKRLLKIKLEHVNKQKISIGCLLLRSLLIPVCANLIFYNAITSLLNVIIIYLFSGIPYLYANLTITYILCLYCYIDILISYIRKDGRMLHDLICKTKVSEIC